MKMIKSIETAIAGKTNSPDINSTLLIAYRNSKKAGNDLIDFNDVVWDTDIEEIVAQFKENRIHEFTISSNFSGLIKVLVEFEKYGFKVSGTCEVFTNYTDFLSGEKARVPAIRMAKA